MFPTVQRTEIDGVPFFWVPEAPRQIANLRFRVGRADEPFRLAGISHLLEHLAIHRIGERKFPLNGSVDHLSTEFVAMGRADENAAYLSDIAAALGDIEATRLGQEARVLRVEDQGRGPNAIREYITLRYGTTTLGRSALQEHALHGTSPDVLRRWAADWFTMGNAAGWMTSEPPAGMRLMLPPGERRPPTQHRDISPLPLPSWGPTQMPGAMVGSPVPRSSASSMFVPILGRRAEARLRRELGLSYEINPLYLKLTRDEALAMVIVTCRDEDAPRVALELMALVATLAEQGPTPEELADNVDMMRRGQEDPMAVVGSLHFAAECELLGYEFKTHEELMAEAEAIRPEDVQATAAWFRANAVGFSRLMPQLSPPWHLYPIWCPDAVAGRTFDSVKKKYPWTKGTPSLVVGPDGVSYVTPEGKCITVRYATCAGVIRFGAKRSVVGEDGFRVLVDPTEWKDGAVAAAQVDRALPPTHYVDWQG